MAGCGGLLDAGISVYTTLNVQHWESLNDVVAQITGVKVRETVPDSFLQKAHEVELVDLPPADLLKRMSEGKVYVGDQAIRAAESFFQIGNLIALRELALRHTAERVDAQMVEFKNRYAISKVFPVRDRLLVGITASPHSARLVRAALRLATSLRCDWITVYVQTPEHQKLPADQKARVIDTLRLAERLGGETAVLTGQNISEEVLNYARSRNVTKIVLGKPSEPRWKELLFRSTVNEIARHSADIDLYVISARDVPDEKPKRYPGLEKSGPHRFLPATILVVLCTILGRMLVDHLDRANLLLLYFLVVVWLSYRYGRKTGIFASILSVLLFDFFLVPPYLTFAVSDTEYFITFAVMLAVALFISTLTGRLRAMAEATRARESHLRSLYNVSRTLSDIPDPSAMLRAVAVELEEFFQSPVLLLVDDAQGTLRILAGDSTKFGYAGNELQAVDWVYQHAEIAGKGTDTLAGSKATYVPLKGHERTVGVLGVRFQLEAELIGPDQLQLLEKFASEIGKALESRELSEAAGRATSSMEAERLKNLVLRSFSYDLAQPSREIYETAKSLTNLTESGNTSILSGLKTLIDKSDQINRVVGRLPQFLQDAFPQIERRDRTPSAYNLTKPAEYSLQSVLSPDRVLFFPPDTGKDEILKSLIKTLPVPDRAATLRSIQEREEAGGILIRPNLAIPHTTIPGIQGVIASLGIRPKDGEGQPDVWLLFVSGTESMKEHLEFLRSVALTFNDEALEQLTENKTPTRFFRSWQARGCRFRNLCAAGGTPALQSIAG